MTAQEIPVYQINCLAKIADLLVSQPALQTNPVKAKGSLEWDKNDFGSSIGYEF